MSQQERKPHKHAEVIKAWADGATIQWRRDWGIAPTEWVDWSHNIGPNFDSLVSFRIKPESIPAGTVLMRCYHTALKAHWNKDEDVWGQTAKLFMQEIKAGNVKED